MTTNDAATEAANHYLRNKFTDWGVANSIQRAVDDKLALALFTGWEQKGEWLENRIDVVLPFSEQEVSRNEISRSLERINEQLKLKPGSLQLDPSAALGLVVHIDKEQLILAHAEVDACRTIAAQRLIRQSSMDFEVIDRFLAGDRRPMESPDKTLFRAYINGKPISAAQAESSIIRMFAALGLPTERIHISQSETRQIKVRIPEAIYEANKGRMETYLKQLAAQARGSARGGRE